MPIAKEKRLLRLGVLGCGPIAQIAHFEACRKAGNAELYAICDVAGSLRRRMAEVHQPRVSYETFEQMLADPQVEAVLIATADQFHVPLAGQAIAAGKHVLVEKPLGVTVEEVEALRSQVKASGLVCQVGHNRRFDPGVAFARHFIRHEIGQVMALKAWYNDSIHRYTMTDSLHPIVVSSDEARRPAGDLKADKSRYFMLTHGSHLVDLARFLAGELVRVQAQRVEKFGAYCWFAAVEFADGSLGHLDLTVTVRGDFEEGFRLYGEYGSVKGRIHLPFYHKAAEVECFSLKDDQFHRPLGQDAQTYKRQIEGFADAILHGRPQLGADVNDGVAGLRALVALARSVERGGWVHLAEVKGGV
jgi:predicted dehydrogenase